MGKADEQGKVTKLRDVIEASVAEQLAAMEHQNRRLRRLSAALFAMSAVGLVVGCVALLAPYFEELRFYLDRALRKRPIVRAETRVVEAGQFILRDAEGKMRAELALRDDGALNLNLYDKDAHPRAGLGVSPEGPASLWVADDDGRATLTPTRLDVASPAAGKAMLSRVSLGVRADGTPSVSLADRDGKSRAAMLVQPDGSPNLALYDRDGRNGALLDVPADGARLGLFKNGVARAGLGYGPGGSRMGLYAGDGTERATLALTDDGATGMVFRDAGGKERVSIGALPDGPTGMTVSDKAGGRRAVLNLLPDGTPHLELYDDGGQRRAVLGLWQDGFPALELRDKWAIRAVLGVAALDKTRGPGVKTQPSSLTLFNRDGGVLFQAPVM